MTLYHTGTATGATLEFSGLRVVGNGASAAGDAQLTTRWTSFGALGGIEVYQNLPEQPLPVLLNTYVPTDAGATITSSVAILAAPAVTSGDVSIGSSVSAGPGPLVTSTGATIGSSVAITAAPLISGAGASIASSVQLLTSVGVNSTGATISSAAVITAAPGGISSTGATIGSSAGLAVGPGVTSAGATIGSSVLILAQPTLTSTGATIGSSVAVTVALGVSSTDVSIGSSVIVRAGPAISTTGSTIGSSVAIIATPTLTSTGATIGSSVVPTVIRQITSAGMQRGAYDTFTRTVTANGWGSEELNATAWTAGSGTGAFFVDGSQGQIGPLAANTNRRLYLGGLGPGDVLVTVDLTSDSVAASGAILMDIFARLQSDHVNGYSLKLSYETNGNVNLTEQVSSGGSTSPIGLAKIIQPGTGSPQAALSTWRTQLLISGTTLYARTWRPALEGVPIFQIVNTDSTWASGDIALFASIGVGATNTPTIAFDNLHVDLDFILPPSILRAVTDTGSTITSSVAITALPALSSTGATIGDSVQVVQGRPVTSTGATIGSSAVAAITGRVTNVSDNGATITSSVAITATPLLSSIGASVTSSVSVTDTPSITSPGATIGSSITLTVTPVVSSTGTTIGSSVLITATPFITSTGATISDSASSAHLVTVTSSDVVIGSNVGLTVQRAVSSTGATIGSSVGRSVVLTIPVSDTGATITSSVSAIPPVFITDTGVQGATIIDTFERFVSSELGNADTGEAWSDVFSFVGTDWSFAVTGHAGFAHTITTNQNQSRGLNVPVGDGDWYADFQFSSHAVGGLQEQGIIIGFDPVSAVYYRAQMREAATGTVTLAVETSRGGGSLIGSRVTLSGADPVANAYTIHVQRRGRLFRSNAYQAGASEPGGWMTSGLSDPLLDPQLPGASGWRVEAGSGNTNFAALTIDNVSFQAAGVGSRVGIRVARPITSVGATIGDSALVIPPPGTATSVGATIGSNVAIIAAPLVASTGATIGSSVQRQVGRQVTSSDVVITSSVARISTIPVIDFGTQADNVLDAFQRVVPGGLGVADTGQAWGDVFALAGFGWAFSVSGGTAIAQPTSQNQRQSRGQVPAQSDGEWMMDVQWSTLAVGGYQEQGLILSHDGTNYLSVTLRQAADGSVSYLASSTTQVPALASGTLVADPVAHAWTIHVRRTGQKLYMRFWQAGTTEPTVWISQPSMPSSVPSSGRSGWLVATGPGNTNLAAARMDNYVDLVPGVDSSVATNRVRPITDSVTISSSVSGVATRPGVVSSTGATITSSAGVQAVHTRLPASVGAVIDSSVGLGQVIVRGPLSAGAVISDSVTASLNSTRPITSSGAVITDTPRITTTRPITSAGATIGSGTATRTVRVISDAVTITSSVTAAAVRGLSSTGASIGSSVTRALSFAITDTGAVITSTAGSGRHYDVAITSHAFSPAIYPSMSVYPSLTLYPGYPMPDSVVVNVTRVPPLTSVGATISSSVDLHTQRLVSSTGATVTSSVGETRYIAVTSIGAVVGSSIVSFVPYVAHLTNGTTAAPARTGATVARPRLGSHTAYLRSGVATTSTTPRRSGGTNLTPLHGSATDIASLPSGTSVRPLVGAAEALV